MALFNILVDIAARTASFEAGMTRVEGKLDGFQRSVVTGARSLAALGAGFASGAGIISFIGSVVRAADEIGDAAERAGVLASELSRMKYVAEQSDVSFESLSIGIKKMQDNISNAARGMKPSVEALAAINIEAGKLKGIGLQEQLGLIADRFKRVTDAEDRTRIAMDLFGKSGADLIPMLMRGRAGINDFAAEADRLGITLDDRATAAIDRNAKAWDRFWRSVKGGSANLVGDMVADIFGLSTEMEDLKVKLEALEAARERARTGHTGAGWLKTSIEEYDQLIAKVQEEIRLLQSKASIIASQSGRRGTFSDNENRRAKEDAEFWSMINAPPKFDIQPLDFSGETEKMIEKDRDLRWTAFVEERQAEGEYWKNSEAELQKMMAAAADAQLAHSLNNERALIDEQFALIDKVSEYEREAQRQTQQLISRTLRDGFDNGFDGALSSFGRMLQDMAIEAAAANIAKYIMGDADSGNAGVVGDVLGWIGGLVGGGGNPATSPSGWSVPIDGVRANGGLVMAGGNYLVGERGPELFVPGSGGSIVPNNQLGGASFALTHNINIGAGNAVTRGEVVAALKVSQDQTIARVHEIRRRGPNR
ncbi:MAG TPA: hypothetical protein VK629_16410 [Steroidobacteraceae bacterium]|nr:hypothetical protein [Steroidobacteraceae bacterium]